ncbi:MAG: DEAD/DEAH box helicase family protein [Candidatus Magnetoovum sp. WYHC-5]|nr:DEAD/DEAH box helicase family protein [Candidatus Magnetoovum sp. WYHC-5]
MINLIYIDNWLLIEDASRYLGIGKTILYTLAREGKIPANKVGKKWFFDKKQLDAWIKASKPVESFFGSVEANIEENLQIREPQREAYQRLYEFFKAGGKKAIVQIPVGCGKSGLASIIPFGIASGRVLIISPNLTIKQGLFEIFNITNRQKCFWRKRDVLKEEDMLAGPFACTLDTGNISVCESSHIVITNVHQLAINTEKWLNKFSDDFFDLIIVDEAHHSAADSWKKVIEKFSKAKVVNMTATPFRSDNQEIEGELVYRYPFKRAAMNGYVKRVKSWYVAPSELTFTAKGQTKTYTLDEVLKMKEKDWFSKGIAVSEVCNQNIVDNSLEKLEELRQTGTQHQIIAVACSVDHAKVIRSMYNSRGYATEVIFSQMEEDKKLSVMNKLKSGEIDCIVQVQMLGEGFDHQKLSVAAIFRPFRTLAPYIQFVGRILRVIIQNDPTHPDNYGHIVTHAGMNLQERLKEFQLFEKDDQKFWEEIIRGEDPKPPRKVIAGETRMRLSEPAVANSEIVESLIGEDFITSDDEDLIKDLEKKLELLGLDPRDAKELVLKQKQGEMIRKPAAPFQKLPQKEWEEARRRLKEKTDRSAGILLNRLELKRQGRKIVNTGVYATNDFVAAITLINQELKKRYPEPRQEWSLEKFKEATEKLEEIITSLTRTYKKKFNG